MSIVASIRSQLAPVHPQGYPFVAVSAIISLALFYAAAPLGWLGTIVTAWMAYFFRDPQRVTPLIDGLFVAPADGRVSLVTRAVPPAELRLGDQALPRISIFMSVFDCHINRSPMTGRIERVVYHPGKFLNADLDKASEENERNAFVISGPVGSIAVVQIAGLVARRIVPFAHQGQAIAAGERIGMIRFGSRVDVYLPEGVAPLVSPGQLAVAGETVIADAHRPNAAPAYRES
jgi:phosphatidylserine decarboxylase